MENPTTTTTEPSVLPAIEIAPPAANGIPVPRRPHRELFLISFLILFFELACIRWFGSTVVFLTFFTNIVLLACFLGMSVGLLTASRRQNFMRAVLPLTFLSVALAIATFNAYLKYQDKITVAVGNQQQSPQLIYFGTEYRPNDPSRFIVPIEAVGGLFFTLIAVTFIGLGQTMGRAFDAINNRIAAYTTDVLGSLTGIALFGLMSFLQLSPHVWFILIIAILLYFVRQNWNRLQIMSALGITFLIALSAIGGTNPHAKLFWSPYYKVAYIAKTGDIDTNNIAQQQMHEIAQTGSAYSLVHLLNRDAGGKAFKDIMIIGAGSGNDVAAALRYGDKAVHIDAVEIDPVINQIGRWDHPDKPYDDPRVSIHLDDGRSFSRKTTGTYDLAIYALVDSLVLHSGYSSIRLENFLFTKQAFEDVKAKLKPGGVFAMYNYYRQGWVVGRIKKLATEVFHAEPIVIPMPFSKTGEITPDENEKDRITFVLCGSEETLKPIREAFASKKTFWANNQPVKNESVNAFMPDWGPLGGYEGEWRRIEPAKVITDRPTTQAATQPLTAEQMNAYHATDDKLLPQDNWPQLYLRDNKIPDINIHGMIMIAGLSVVILLIFAWPVFFSRSGLRGRPSGMMFFLGAGFMLLETKGVVHMALLFGSTWIVNSVVFFAILVLILFANIFTLIMRPQKLWPYYVLLLAALVVNALVPMDWFLGLPGIWKTVGSCGVVFVPVFFAGVIFATAFRDSEQPDVDFGSNVAGIILGGLSEQLSLMLGFNYLLLVAIGYYALSALLRKRPPKALTDTPVATPALATA